jgi:hypothetical protein
MLDYNILLYTYILPPFHLSHTRFEQNPPFRCCSYSDLCRGKPNLQASEKPSWRSTSSQANEFSSFAGKLPLNSKKFNEYSQYAVLTLSVPYLLAGSSLDRWTGLNARHFAMKERVARDIPRQTNTSSTTTTTTTVRREKKETTTDKSIMEASNDEWRRFGEARRKELVFLDVEQGGTSFQLNEKCRIQRYFQLADRVSALLCSERLLLYQYQSMI